MQTIAKRIVEIKRELDELEAHVNSTLSILDCPKLILNEYPKDYKDFKWREYSSYYDWRCIYKTEEETIAAINKYKTIFDVIHAKNEPMLQKNTETFNKICDFFVKLGLSKTTYAYSGTGKNRRSYNTDSSWVINLKEQYPMIDGEYTIFIEWYKKESCEINRFWADIKEKERIKKQKEYEKIREREDAERQLAERTKAVNLAVEFLVANGKIAGRDFNNDNCIDCAFELKAKLLEEMNKPKKEQEIIRPRTINAISDLEV